MVNAIVAWALPNEPNQDFRNDTGGVKGRVRA